MPSSVRYLFDSARLQRDGAVRWREPIPSKAPGVYVVSLGSDPDSISETLSSAAISPTAITQLLGARPKLTVDGSRSDVELLSLRVAEFWLPDESILYVGLAGTSLRDRVQAYYSTKLGRRSPHAGGWFLKLLENIEDLWVHYAVSDDPGGSEHEMLDTFVSAVSPAAKRALRDPDHPFPFANLEWPRGVRKQHGIRGATGDARSGGPGATQTNQMKPSAPRRRIPRDVHVEQISAYIQAELRRRNRGEVTAVEAARWLDEAGLLRDSQHRRGLPLRNLLRAGLIEGQRQEPNSRWFIDRVATH